MTAARYDGHDHYDHRARPRRPDWQNHPGRPTRGLHPVTILGEHTRTSECEHPVSARVWPNQRGYRAACHDCGMKLTYQHLWVVEL